MNKETTKKGLASLTALVLGILATAVLPGTAGEGEVYFTKAFTKEEFAARRLKLMEAIGPNAVAVIRGNEGMRGYQEFVQSNNMFYLSGVEAPGAILLLDGATKRSVLFLPPQNAGRERSEGPLLVPGDEASRLTGIENVQSTEKFTDTLSRMVAQSESVFVPMAPQELEGMSRDLAGRYNRERQADPWDGRVSREAHFAGLLRQRFSGVDLKDLSPVLDRLRLIKSPQEIEALRKSTDLSVQAILESMRSTLPGQYEYELDALGQFIFFRNGAEGLAYYALVAADKNAYRPHYHAGRTRMKDGDFLLYDFGPEYNYYATDVTRMWPVNGKFSPVQRELYGFYLKLYKAMIGRIRPYVPISTIVEEIAGDWETILNSSNFSQEKFQRAADSFVKGYRERANRRGRPMLGHWVGLATHDVGGPVEELKPGMVFTIEPQFRIPDDEIYVRLEDMLLVTENGVENLSAALPMEMDRIEAVMKEEGILERYPRLLPHDALRPGKKE